jgi:PadR family transcriptional regulator PadR
MPAIRDASGEMRSAEEGSLCPALHRMGEAGWVLGKWITKNIRRARPYGLTALGRKQFVAEKSRWQAVTAARTAF